MPSVSKKQRRFMGMAKAIKEGKKVPGASAAVKKAAKGMTSTQLSHYAGTKEKGLPMRRKSIKRSKGRK